MPPSEHDDSASDDRAPLLSSVRETDSEAMKSGGSPRLLRRNLLGDGLSSLAQLGLLIFLVLVWVLVLTHPAGLFTPHPLLQSVGTALFLNGILVLQPIRNSKEAKHRGLQAHRAIQFTGLAVIVTGATFIIYNKIVHQAPHFTSWHGRFGLATLAWLATQVVIGVAVSVPSGQRLLGGEARAKSLWKYHRASGYVLAALLLCTVLTATWASDWFVKNSDYKERVAIGVGLLSVATGLFGRIDFGKMQFRKQRTARS